MTTVVLLTVVFAYVVVGTLLWAIGLRWGLAWAKAPSTQFRRVLFVSLVVQLLSVVVVTIALVVAPLGSRESFNWWMIGAALAQISLAIAAVMRAFSLRLGRAIQAWLPSLLTGLVGLALSELLVKPFVLDTFQPGTNSMAPTLLGPHVSALCPTCGGTAFGTPPPAIPVRAPRAILNNVVQMICEDCYGTHEVTEFDEQLRSADRFIVAKYLAPRRWDLMTFRFPQDPEQIYVKRIVGLPGERIAIRDGRVFADGRPLTPLEEIEGIVYLDRFPGTPQTLWGTEERPAQLGDDEYFVLGDFSAASADSRVWESGAPGHNAFAVPASHVLGIVTHRVWPFYRWTTFR